MKRTLITGLTLLMVLTSGINLTAATKSNIIVIPEPKEEQYHDSKIVIAKNKQSKVSIIHNGNLVIATELAGIIKQQSGATVAVNSKAGSNSSALIIMDIGGKYPAVNELGINIPSQPEGYAIKSGTWRGKPVIVLAGRDKAGLYWSVQTLRQLFVKQSGNLLLPQCSIRDWPDLAYRSVAGHDSLTLVKNNLKYKINISHIPPWLKSIRGKWDNPDPVYWNKLNEAIAYAIPRGGWINQWVEPYDAGQGDNPSQKNINCNEDEIQKFYQTFKKGLKQGNRVVTIGIDDHAGHPGHVTKEDLKRFGSAPKIHAYIISRVANLINKEFPGTTICTIPGAYHGSEDIEKIYDAAGVPKNVIVMWTGPKTITYDFKEQDVAAMVKGLEGRRFVLFDNTFGQPLGKARGPVLFETYASGYSALLTTDKFAGIHVMGVMGRNSRFVIKVMQVADYLWNAKRYNPERSRQRVLSKIAGTDAVESLLNFRREIIKVAKVFPIDKTIKQLQYIGYLKSIIVTAEQHKTNIALLKQAGVYLKQIEQTCKNRKLVKELQELHKNSINIVNYYYQKNRQGKTVKPEGLVKFEFPTDIVGGTYFRNYAWKCPKRNGVAVYGKAKLGGSKAFINFKLDQLPSKDVTLIVEGQACQGIVHAIRINGTTLLKAKDVFPYGNWVIKELIIKKSLLKQGLNTIEFETLNAGHGWIMTSKAELKF